ncbi:putative DNA-binding domain-containing protein [Alteromonas sp. CI.11.F.A3]|uniref:HvfC family RiPP maturation protein n=1 Tax=Alteromonas sp. CI.11.F.A3 TaxID=3079555 RepID=UPI002943E717|nr:putative DNA-binding domain-containing protein [Alteromonas sp. CI.11.F.A3]WOI38911.1 putative DNA-binding domain-containing protein [Alteromonas sp. CI.11.F.A3]
MSENFKSVQQEFVNAIKDPDSFETNDADIKRRMDIYQSLFFNNISGFISTGFPVLKSLVSEENWNALVRAFFIHHESRSPYFSDISKEFVEYLSASPELSFQLPAFAAELAHYEWLELDISIRKTFRDVVYFNVGEQVTTVSVSPLATLASYTYPVHLIGVDHIPEAPAPEQQFYVVYRNEEQRVEFVHLNPLTAVLLHTIEQHEQGIDIDALGEQLRKQLDHLPEQTVLQGMQQIVSDMLQKGILLPS